MVNRGVAATAVLHRAITVSAGCHSFETRNPVPYGVVDPVLHVWGSPSPGAPPTELDWDDDRGALAHLGFAGQPHMAFANSFCPTSTTTVTVVVYAYSPAKSGRIDLYVDGTLHDLQVKVGSTKVNAPSAYPWGLPSDLEVQTAFEAGGTTDSRLYAFDADGRLTGMDDDGGVGWQSWIRASSTSYIPPFSLDAAIRSVRVASTGETNEGAVSVIFNDFTLDDDGDKLGKSLEAELGTCDNRYDVGSACPAWFTGPAAASYSEKDTDRDGIPDDFEVFGKEHLTHPQYFPRWGANPAHKDVFIELDWRFAVTHPVDYNLLYLVQQYYLAAPASHIHNPDGTGGLNLHFDNGITPTVATTTLHGSWGGSNRLADESLDHEKAFPVEMPVSNPRRGVFRYLLIDVNRVAGSAIWQHFGVGVKAPWDTYPQSRVDFAHELGHTLGIDHHGEPYGAWGTMNCNPLYRSVMNYTEGDEGFSVGNNADTIIDPSNLVETSVPISFGWTTVGSSQPYNYLARLNAGSALYDVDFNRDGEYLDPSSGVGHRGVFPWVTGTPITTICQTHLYKARAFDDNSVAPAPRAFIPTSAPIMVRTLLPSKQLYVFRSSPTGIVYAKTNRPLADDNGSCAKPNAASLLPGEHTNPCDEFGDDYPPIPSTTGIRGFSVIYTAYNKVLVAYQNSAGTILSNEGEIYPTGEIVWTDLRTVESGARSVPELSEVVVPIFGGTATLQTVTYVGADGNFRWRRKQSAVAWEAATPLLTATGAAIVGTGSATVASIPASFTQAPMVFTGMSGPFPIKTCAIFPSGVNAEAAFYCYDPNLNRWNFHPDAFKGGSTRTSVGSSVLRLRAKPGLTIHYPRVSGGLLWTMGSADVRAEFWATLPLEYDPTDMPPWTYPPNMSPYVYTTAAFPFNTTSIPNGLRFVKQTPLADQGETTLGLSTLHETQDATSLRGAYFGPSSIVLLPFVDGGLKAQLSDGSDFRVMERGICRLFDTDACPIPNEWGY